MANVDRNKKKKEKIRKKNKKKKNKKKVPSPVISYKVSSKRFQQLKAAMVNKGEKDILRLDFHLMNNVFHIFQISIYDQQLILLREESPHLIIYPSQAAAHIYG